MTETRFDPNRRPVTTAEGTEAAQDSNAPPAEGERPVEEPVRDGRMEAPPDTRVPDNQRPALDPPSVAQSGRERVVRDLGRTRGMAAPRYEIGADQVQYYGIQGLRNGFGENFERARELMAIQRDPGTQFTEAHFAELTDLVRNSGNPPGAVAAILGQLDYVDEDDRSLEAFSPYQTMLTPGVCRDQHTLAAHLLQQAGYETAVTGYGAAGDILHRNMVFKDPETGDWAALEYGYVSTFPGTEDFFDVVQALNPGALAFRFFEVSEGPNDISRIQAVVRTEQGRRLVDTMRGSGITPGEVGLTVEGSNGQAATRYTFDNGLSFEIVGFQAGNEAPVLNDGFAAIARHTTGDEDSFVRFSGGVAQLNDVPYNDIGRYRWNETDVGMVFVAMEGRTNLFDTVMRSMELARGNAELRFNMPIAGGAQTGFAWSDASSEEHGLMNGMTGFDFDAAPGLELDYNQWDAYARLALSANEALALNLAEGGYRDLGQIPVRFGPRLGASWEGAALSLGAELDYSMTGPIDARRQGLATVSAGMDLGRFMGLDSNHRLGLATALEAGFGGSVFPDDDAVTLRPGGRMSYTLDADNDMRISFEGGYQAATHGRDDFWSLSANIKW